MGYFDIGNTYDPAHKVTMAELCKEIAEEIEKAGKYTAHDEGYYRDKFKNADQSGIIDKLKKKLDFDIEGIYGNDPKQKFEAFKLLKLLYYIEKDGAPKNRGRSTENTKIQIIDILSKPRLENIQTPYAVRSQYGKIYSALSDELCKEVPDAAQRIETLKAINVYWDYMIDEIFGYVLPDEALLHPQEAMKELIRIENFLKEKVLNRLDSQKIAKLPNNEGVMKTFYNMLICHEFLCNDIDRINVNYRICFSSAPNSEYADIYKKCEGQRIRWDSLDILKQALEIMRKGEIDAFHKTALETIRQSENDAGTAGFFLKMISYGKDIPENDIKHYKYVLGKVRTVAEWFYKQKNSIEKIETDIPCDIFILIMQELIAVKKNRESLRNDYYGYTQSERSLLAAVKNPDTAEAIAIQAWIKKLENRVAVNLGAIELIRKKRDIENIIIEIKKVLYSYHSLDDLKFANRYLCHWIARSIISRGKVLNEVGVRFTDEICDNLSIAPKQFRFFLPPEAMNVCDLFREFTYNEPVVEHGIANGIAKQIDDCYKDNDCVFKNLNYTMEIPFGKETRQYILLYSVDKSNNWVTFKQFYEIVSDENIQRMNDLGLEGFVLG